MKPENWQLSLMVMTYIILLAITHHEGYKGHQKKIETVSVSVDRAINARLRAWMSTAERYVSRQLDRTKDIAKRKAQKKLKHYNKMPNNLSRRTSFTFVGFTSFEFMQAKNLLRIV
uniref:Uncharacterized protein n=1 Tax=Glossina morsitans morsitans TaxID=37546 RepID=A0A1B0G885_GLOMM